METQDRLPATAKDAQMLLALFDRVLCDREASISRLTTASLPLYGIRWAAPVAKALGPREINKLLTGARNSHFPEKGYNSLASLLCDALAGDFESPPSWADWRLLVGRFELDLKFSLHLPLPVVHWVVLQGSVEPFQLAIISMADLKMRAAVSPRPELAFDVWKADVLAFAIPGDSSDLALRGVSYDAEDPIARFPAAPKESRLATPSDRLIRKPSAPSIGPCAKLKALRATRVPRTRSPCTARRVCGRTLCVLYSFRCLALHLQ